MAAQGAGDYQARTNLQSNNAVVVTLKGDAGGGRPRGGSSSSTLGSRLERQLLPRQKKENQDS